MIDTIVFDFGGVLIDWDPRNLYKQVFIDNEEMEWFLSNVCSNEWNLEQDRGRPFSEATMLLKKDFPEHAVNIDLYYSRWEEMLKGEMVETVLLLKQLKTKYKLYGLTNWSAETFPIAFKKFEFFQLFDGIVVSGEEKMIKPDKSIFQLLLKRFKLEAGNCLFIDDSKWNVDAAGELGLHAIHFTNANQLKSELSAVGVL